MQNHSFIVDGQSFQVANFNVMAGVAFTNKVIGKLNPVFDLSDIKKATNSDMFAALSKILADEDSAEIIEKALKQVITPCGKLLRNADVFETYLKENSNIIYELSAKAVFYLIKDFLPKQYLTMVQEIEVGFFSN